MRNWKKLPQNEIRDRVFKALQDNVNYYDSNILGVPASHLDQKVFYQDAPFLDHAPYLSTLIHNPNHIGCHTLGESESFFEGTQQIEKELISICAEEILLGGNKDEFDGYVASGGTEANMQAIWVYRNYFIQERQLKPNEICILCSDDSHYSTSKAANVLNIDIAYVAVKAENRKLIAAELERVVSQKHHEGTKAFIVVANMMTTMFGSVDDVTLYTDTLEAAGAQYKLHIDGAYGGFFYPFSNDHHLLNFSNPKVDSITLDAHKMLQAPYGTGIFLCRKGLINYANTKEASYVEGEDYTLIGSRSGANAIAVWMILMTYGPHGWKEKILILLNRTDWLCRQLDSKGVRYFREQGSNIVTIKSTAVKASIAKKYGLVPDNHQAPSWYKVVIMEHVTIEKLEPLIDDL